MHRTADRFWKCFDNLPATVQKIARQNFQLLKENPWHPSLHFKRVGSFLASASWHQSPSTVEAADDYIWVWIGTHDEYERMV